MSAKNNTPTIQEKMTELAQIVAWFDSDDFQLEAAFDRFKEAEKIATNLEQDLTSMKNEIDVLKKRFDGETE